MDPEFHMQPLWKIDIPSIVELSNAAFADYHVPIQFNQSSFLSFLVAMGVSWDLSRVILEGKKPAGFILIARRGWGSRVATMGFLPDSRNKGCGHQTLARIIDEARERGDRSIELEVITANQPAVHIYKKSGFRIIQDLYGFKRPAGGTGQHETLEEVDIREVARMIASAGAPDLPWQLSAETLACYGPPMKGFQCEGAYAVISDPSQPSIAMMSLIVEPEERGEGRATTLLRSLVSRYSETDFTIPALCPAVFEPLFTPVGFERSELSQHHMRLDLEAVDRG